MLALSMTVKVSLGNELNREEKNPVDICVPYKTTDWKVKL